MDPPDMTDNITVIFKLNSFLSGKIKEIYSTTIINNKHNKYIKYYDLEDLNTKNNSNQPRLFAFLNHTNTINELCYIFDIKKLALSISTARYK